MTYNFDPDRWYAIEREALLERLRAGDLPEEKFRQMSEALDQRYDQMIARLDGTYRIPDA